MTKEFEQYIHHTRNEFVTAVNELQWNTGFRTKCENLLIAYDQMKQALQQPPVSGQSERLKAFVEEYVEAWENGMAGDHSLYNKAKSL